MRGDDVEKAHRAEAGPMMAELLRRGWSEEALRAAMDDPNRDRFEWPRQFRERFKRDPKLARTPRKPANGPPGATGATPDPVPIDQAVIDFARRKGLHGIAKKLAAGQVAQEPVKDPPPTAPE